MKMFGSLVLTGCGEASRVPPHMMLVESGQPLCLHVDQKRLLMWNRQAAA